MVNPKSSHGANEKVSSIEPYEIYVETYGRVRSGHVLTGNDYQEGVGIGSREFDLERKIAVSLASQDCAGEQPLRTQSAFAMELRRLLDSDA